MAKGKKTGGRKAGTPNKSTLEIKGIIDSEVDFSVVVSKMYELVKGVEVQGTNRDGTTYAIDLQPNPSAARILLEYRFGKPREVIELDTGANAAEVVKMFGEMVFSARAGQAT
jgi:hypothetical protein